MHSIYIDMLEIKLTSRSSLHYAVIQMSVFHSFTFAGPNTEKHIIAPCRVELSQITLVDNVMSIDFI